MKTNFTIVAAMLLISLQCYAQAPNYAPAQIKNPAQYTINGNELLQPFKTTGGVIQSSKRITPFVNPQSTTLLLDSAYTWTWDSTANAWQYDSKLLYTYYTDNNLATLLEKDWIAGAWVNSMLSTFNTYNANNGLTSSLIQQWNAGAWVNFAKGTNTYDNNNNLTSMLTQSWTSGAWVNGSLYTSTYNGNTDSTLVQIWTSGAWVMVSLYIDTYTNNNPTSVLIQRWNPGWVNWVLATYTYNGDNKVLTALSQIWNNGWGNNSLETDTYDANNNLISSLDQVWNSVGWVNASQSIETNNSNNYILSQLEQKWEGNAFVNNDSVHYYYHTVVGINELTAQEQNINIYPNPATNQLTLTTSSLITSKATTVSIINVLGQEALPPTALKMSGENATIYIGDLPAAMYFLRLKSEDGIVTKRFVKE